MSLDRKIFQGNGIIVLDKFLGRVTVVTIRADGNLFLVP